MGGVSKSQVGGVLWHLPYTRSVFMFTIPITILKVIKNLPV